MIIAIIPKPPNIPQNILANFLPYLRSALVSLIIQPTSNTAPTKNIANMMKSIIGAKSSIAIVYSPWLAHGLS